MEIAEEEFARALEFAIASIRLAIDRLDSRVERLEDAFLRTHPAAYLAAIPPTAAEDEFMERYADLIEPQA